MTENKPSYQAFSDLPTGTARYDSASPLDQHYTDGTTSRDRLLLIPMLQSGHTADCQSVCLHVVHLDNGTLGLCNTETDQRCPCCTNAVCKTHQSKQRIVLPDQYAWAEEYIIPLCAMCAALPRAQRRAVHALLELIRELEGAQS